MAAAAAEEEEEEEEEALRSEASDAAGGVLGSFRDEHGVGRARQPGAELGARGDDARVGVGTTHRAAGIAPAASSARTVEHSSVSRTGPGRWGGVDDDGGIAASASRNAWTSHAFTASRSARRPRARGGGGTARR